MAQNLQQRLAAAKSPRARIADNDALLDDLKAELERLANARDVAAGESIDFALSDDDRDAAAAKAARLDRTIRALEIEIAEVAALTEARRSDDARKAAEAAKRAALAERDEIAARFAKRVPVLTAELIELLKAVKGNADRMRRAGVNEADAELIARGLPANGHVQATPVLRFVEMRIPTWSSYERAWPVSEVPALGALVPDLRAQMLAAKADAERAEAAKAEAKARFAREHGRYEITAQPNGNYDGVVRIPRELVVGDVPAAVGPGQRVQPIIAHEIAERLAKVPGLKVTRLDGGAQ